MNATGGDRGAATIEVVVLSSGLVLFICLMILAGRLAIAHQSVGAAAAEAAREASIQRTAPTARVQARKAAEASLANQGLDCGDVDVELDTGDFSKAPGVAGEVSATVSCRVELKDLALPGVPGSRWVDASAVSPLDTYRGGN